MKKIALLIIFLLSASICWGANETIADPDNNAGSSRQMMGEIEQIIYGYVSQGGLIDRLAKVEEDLFGRSLPGTIAERHAAILNFLDIGTDEQPSMMFKLGVAEWIVDKRIHATTSAVKRLENLETNLTGASRSGNPIAMRIETLLATLVMDPVTGKRVVLPGDVAMKVRFMDELSPAVSKAGDYVRLELANDLIVNNCLVAPTGSLLITEVRDVKRPRMFGVPGEVRLAFNELKPLGPQRPPVKIGDASQAALREARKTGDKGEGAIIGAGAVSLAGAALLGPVGLVSGVFIRGNSLKIPVGSVTFVQTSGDCVVSSYPIPASLQVNTYSITTTAEPASENNNSNADPNYDPDRDTIIKGDVFNGMSSPRNPANQQTTQSTNTGTSSNGEFELPPEQPIN